MIINGRLTGDRDLTLPAAPYSAIILLTVLLLSGTSDAVAKKGGHGERPDAAAVAGIRAADPAVQETGN